MKDLRGRNALLTGAAGGIGVHIARALAGEGVRVALSGRNSAALEELRDHLRANGATAEVVTADLGDAGAVAGLIAETERVLGPIDILVNNAGLEFTSSFTRTTLDELKSTIDVNLLAPTVLTHGVVPGMLERGRGHIVQISSVAGKAGPPYDSVYAATKAGLVGLTQGLRAEYRDTPVGFSVICPGFIADDGMFGRAQEKGVRAPFMAAPSKPEKVGAAVIKAIRRDVPEIIVNSSPLRPVLALGTLWPRAGEFLFDRVGVAATFRAMANARDALAGSDDARGETAVASQPAAPGREHADGNGRPEPVHAGEHGDDARQAGEGGADESGGGG
jgi:short-subunit dehydrogenase